MHITTIPKKKKKKKRATYAAKGRKRNIITNNMIGCNNQKYARLANCNQ